MSSQLPAATELVDLHIHVGGAVAPHILWQIAQDHGFKLPVKDYWEFCDLITADPDRVKSLDDYVAIMHEWTEKIQSSPAAIELSVYEIMGKEYRSSRVSHIELRFNPMKRNLGGERDLDHIIAAAIRGMERASLAYGISAGLIFCLAREFDYELNEILARKAERYAGRGVVAIDLAGPERHTRELGDEVDAYAELFDRARHAGLGTTIHTGETAHTGAEGVIAVVERLRPDRIGHGVAAASSEEAMRKLVERDVVLELCPTSNLRTHAVEDLEEFGRVIERFREAGVRYTVNTDGPYLLGTTLRGEFDLLLRHGIVSGAEVRSCVETARAASFIRT
ncbi:MAG: adenosine deaminase [Actinomycetota bacterium]